MGPATRRPARTAPGPVPVLARARSHARALRVEWLRPAISAPMSRTQPTVDLQDAAVDVRGRVTGEERDTGRHLVGVAEAASGNGGKVRVDRFDHGGGDEPGRDRIDRDPAFTDL